MPDQFTSSATTGFGARILDSLKGILIGLLLCIVSFGVLYWNEGRADISVVAKQAVTMDASTQNNTPLNGKLVAANGIVHGETFIGDQLFLNPGKYLSVHRVVEMYAWVEKQSSKTTKNLGGSETTETTYTYEKEWTSSPVETSKFAHPEDHQNPTPSIRDSEVNVNSAKVGEYTLDVASIDFPKASPVILNAQTVKISSTSTVILANSEYLFLSQTPGSAFNAPQIGDLRIRYEAVPADVSMTVFGKLEGPKLGPFVTTKGDTLYRAFLGSKDEAVAAMHSEYTSLSWMLRFVGFLMMWFGLAMLLGPVSVLLDILPVAGSISRGLIGLIAAVIALALSFVTILISMILHSLLALILTLVVTFAVMILVMKLMKKRSNGITT